MKKLFPFNNITDFKIGDQVKRTNTSETIFPQYGKIVSIDINFVVIEWQAIDNPLPYQPKPSHTGLPCIDVIKHLIINGKFNGFTGFYLNRCP